MSPENEDKIINRIWSMAEKGHEYSVNVFIKYLNYVMAEGIEYDFEILARLLASEASNIPWRPTPIQQLMQHAFEWEFKNEYKNEEEA